MRISKHGYPFRIGCTSYVKPDDVIPNIQFMGKYVDDIEVILFESPEISNLPSEDDVSRLQELSHEHDITYSIHFPTTHKAGGAGCDAFRHDALKVIDLAGPLQPSAWIMHLDGLKNDSSETEIADWSRSCNITLEACKERLGDLSSLAIENLACPWGWHSDLAGRFGAALCLDVGHLWVHHADTWEEDVLGMLPATRVVHLHGVRDGRDHISLEKSCRDHVSIFLSHLKRHRFDGVLTLEVFNEKDTEESLQLVADIWGGI